MELIELFRENPAGQIFGFLAMFVAFVGLLQKDDRNTVKIIMVSSTLWIIHFFFMGVYSAMAMSCIGIVRLCLSLKYKKNTKVFFAVITSMIIVGAMTYENKLSLLPIVGSCFSAYGYFFEEKYRLRLFIFISSMFRLTFNLRVGSIAGSINEIVSQLILIFVMYKLVRESDEGMHLIKKISSFFQRAIPDAGHFIVLFDYIREFKEKTKDKIFSVFYNLSEKIKRINKKTLKVTNKKMAEIKEIVKH